MSDLKLRGVFEDLEEGLLGRGRLSRAGGRVGLEDQAFDDRRPQLVGLSPGEGVLRIPFQHFEVGSQGVLPAAPSPVDLSQTELGRDGVRRDRKGADKIGLGRGQVVAEEGDITHRRPVERMAFPEAENRFFGLVRPLQPEEIPDLVDGDPVVQRESRGDLGRRIFQVNGRLGGRAYGRASGGGEDGRQCSSRFLYHVGSPETI